MKITDYDVIKKSGESIHTIACPTHSDTDTVPGVVLTITKKELEYSDKYEVKEYKRVLAQLESGQKAWVYVKS